MSQSRRCRSEIDANIGVKRHVSSLIRCADWNDHISIRQEDAACLPMQCDKRNAQSFRGVEIGSPITAPWPPEPSQRQAQSEAVSRSTASSRQLLHWEKSVRGPSVQRNGVSTNKTPRQDAPGYEKRPQTSLAAAVFGTAT
ncbi:hypothetical protein HPB50_027059 [Hyalomma asiaticum]|uniref:Uncharacterized protein n=1 Tax=Hyalomma asiaticum TaxID=266040 RepID=A0ACB7RQT2_HYAAI|nr:hypothetical protein HPB50_027059 [Hyalomma asiaticum]